MPLDFGARAVIGSSGSEDHEKSARHEQRTLLRPAKLGVSRLRMGVLRL